MRILRWMILSTIFAAGTMAATAPATAQTYDPNFPVCLLVHGSDGSYNDCTYSSMPQCAASASGRGAECFVNPFFAHAGPPGRVSRRRGHAY